MGGDATGDDSVGVGDVGSVALDDVRVDGVAVAVAGFDDGEEGLVGG